MAKILTVFGASGIQGGSVVQAVLNDNVLTKEFDIRAVTRAKAKAEELSKMGVEVVAADMNEPTSLADAVRGSHTVFLVTNFWASMSADTEIAQGKAVANACKEAGVQHLIFSSLINTKEASRGRLPNISHFDGKAEIEQYIRSLGIPATFVLPGYYMSNLTQTIRKNDDGSYILALPISEEKAKLPLFDASGDTGKFVNGILKAHPNGTGMRVYAASDYYTPKRLITEFSEVLGKPAAFVQIPQETFKSFLPPPVAQELLENHLLCEDPGYYAGADLSESLSIADPKPTSWKEFVQANKAKWA